MHRLSENGCFRWCQAEKKTWSKWLKRQNIDFTFRSGYPIRVASHNGNHHYHLSPILSLVLMKSLKSMKIHEKRNILSKSFYGTYLTEEDGG